MDCTSLQPFGQLKRIGFERGSGGYRPTELGLGEVVSGERLVFALRLRTSDPAVHEEIREWHKRNRRAARVRPEA